jgi:hypothetical protein
MLLRLQGTLTDWLHVSGQIAKGDRFSIIAQSPGVGMAKIRAFRPVACLKTGSLPAASAVPASPRRML